MPELSEEQIHRRRKNAAANLAAGGLMVGGAAATAEHMSQKTGVKNNLAAIREIAATKKVLPKHGKHAAAWLGTRGVAAAGVPLAAMGAKNLLAPKPKHVRALDIKDDVIGEAVDRTAVGLPNTQRRTPASKKARLAEIGTVTAGSGLGAAGGARLGRRLKGKARLVGVGLGTAAGATAGAIGAAPVGRKAVRATTKGEFDYSTERGVYRRRAPVSKMDSHDAAINTLAQREQKDLVRRKKKQSKYSLASAGLGATALGLQSPRLAALAVRRAPRMAKVKPLKAVADWAPKGKDLSSTVGVGSLGVGALGSLNFARINRSETKADQRSATALKDVKKSAISKMGEVDADKYLDSKKGRKHPYGAQRTLQDVDDYYRLVHGGRSKPERVAHHMESNLNPERAKAKQAKVAREIDNRKTIERSLNMQNFIRTASGGKDPSDHDFAVADELGRRRKAGLPDAARIRSKTEIRNLKARQAAVHESRSTGKRLAPRQPDPHEESDQGFRDLGEHFYRKNPHPQLGNPYKNPSPHYKTQLDRVRTPAQKTQHNVDLAKALLPSLKTFKRPPRFAGVKTGGLRLIRNPLTGLQRQVTVRGSVG